MKIRHKLFDRVTVYTSEGELEISGTTVVGDHIGQILLSKNENLEEVTEESKEENIEKEPVTEVENEEKYKKGKDKK